MLLCGFLVALGAYLRLKNFGFPDSFQFDEHHFVENARNYLNKRPDWNDHPPLGKLFIAASIAAFGDHAFSWRLPSLLFGIFTVVLAGVVARRLFHSMWAGLFAAALASADGFLISYSRAALLDGVICAMALLSLLAATLERKWLVLVGSFAAGVAMSVKFSGVGALAAPAVTLLCSSSKRSTKTFALMALGAGAVSIYVAGYWLGFHLQGTPLSLGRVAAETTRLFAHHAALTEMKNPATSSWPTWVLPSKPIVLGSVRHLGEIRVLTSLGNLALWWASWAVLFYELASLGWHGIEVSLRSESRAPGTERAASSLTLADGRATITILATALGFLAPWVLSHRDSYIYHFLPSYGVMLVLLAGYLSRQLPVRPKTVFGFFAAATVVAGFLGPLWCYLPLSESAFALRLPFSGWR